MQKAEEFPLLSEEGSSLHRAEKGVVCLRHEYERIKHGA